MVAEPIEPGARKPVTLIFSTNVEDLILYRLLHRVLLVHSVIQKEIQVSSWVLDFSVPGDVVCLDGKTVKVAPQVLVLALIYERARVGQSGLRVQSRDVEREIHKLVLVLIYPLVDRSLHLLRYVLLLCLLGSVYYGCAIEHHQQRETASEHQEEVGRDCLFSCVLFFHI